MNKLNLTVQIANAAGLTKISAMRTLQATIDTITYALKNNYKIVIIGFSGFSVKKRNSCVGRKPQIDNVIAIAAFNSPLFAAGKLLKEAVN